MLKILMHYDANIIIHLVYPPLHTQWSDDDDDAIHNMTIEKGSWGFWKILSLTYIPVGLQKQITVF